MPSTAELLEAAAAFARAAGQVTLRHFGSVLRADEKEDGSPVTRADREAEALLRERIRSDFPGHGILGEEEGEEPGTEPIRWVLDPIDGTRSFMQGVPLYTVLVAVEVEGEPVVGVIHCPALDDTVAAGRGLGCLWNGESASVSRTDELSGALVLTTDLRRVLGGDLEEGWRALSGKARVVRGWGDAYGHLLVATGRADVMVDPELQHWDAAPLLPILREAGGRFSDLAGNETVTGGSGLSTNGRLHDEALGLLGGET